MSKPSPSILKRARERTGESQDEIAAKFKKPLTQPAVSHWESLDSVPHPELWPDIADAYGISLHEVTEHFLKARKAS